MPLPGGRAWRTCWNTSVLCTFISALIGEIRSRSTSNALTRAARSARKSIRGTTWWGWGSRRIRRRRISRTNGKPRVFQPTCIQGRHGKAALNRKDRLLPSRQRLRNRLLKRTLLLLRRLPLRLRLQLLPGSRRRLPVRRPANQARSATCCPARPTTVLRLSSRPLPSRRRSLLQRLCRQSAVVETIT